MSAEVRPSMNAQESVSTIEELKARFREIFRQAPTVYRAPGRVNLIGEHTDYNDGFVFPAAINLFTYVGIAPRSDKVIRVHSENFGESVEFALDGARGNVPAGWARYIFGVALILECAGHAIKGADVLIRGEVPIGAGVSSSASVEVASGYALLANSEQQIEGRKLARICQEAENEIVGTRSGIMDQLASACGVAGRALLLDCRSLDFRALPLSDGIRLVICNTMVKRELASSAYNTRRAECEEGVRILSQQYSEIHALRDATMEQLDSCRAEIPDNVFRRCRHVITEDARVMEAALALEQGRLADLRRAMAESHQSLRDDYEVSCAELDLLVELAGREAGVRGARMTGAGFGGCTINLVEADAVREFREHVAAGYEQGTGIKPDIYVCDAADGAKSID